ncbi:hypothetical protein F53441_2658 [Fusarium austroafricanum]|uniref:ThuA-like domain-containing protein n=1 Tax=Fusarium austroafricanum TaxID=2364996 RepID=A0A8H4NXL2_9HYPO|nr:hypothetical protein F53441_2658 [Fusarium austroafricanum]
MGSTDLSSIKVLLVTKACGYRHACIPSMISAFDSFPFTVKATEDTSDLLSLSQFDVVALGHNTGEFLTDEEVDALSSFVENGGGVVGIHAATSGMSTNAKYTRILGEVFNGHPPPQWMVLMPESHGHYIHDLPSFPSPESIPASASEPPITLLMGLPSKYLLWFDEVYTFKSNGSDIRLAKDRVILLSVQGGVGHESICTPLSWTQDVGKGRVYYTALGHFEEAYRDPWFLGYLRRAIVWTAKRE